MKRDILWTQGTIGPLTLRNRTVRSATNEHLSTSQGQLTQTWVDTLTQLAQNDVGLIITGHLTVDRLQRADLGQPVLDSQIDMTLLKAAADGVHGHGGAIVAQLSHSGIKGDVSANHRPAKAPTDFTVDELHHLVESFVQGALRCQEAGFDGVQIHTAHGYCLSNFLNPQENLRQDNYGGTLEHRFHLIAQILSGVRKACGKDFALLVKADCNSCGDFSKLLSLYQNAGVDAIEVSGIDFGKWTGQKQPFYLDQLLSAKADISVPLILVGGIFSLETAQSVLEQGIDFVSFSRSLICQPDFIARMASGEQTESRCLACNNCYTVYRRQPQRCVLHQTPIPQLESVFGPYDKC